MASSVVQTNRAVYAESETSTLSAVHADGLEPAAVVVEVLSDGTDQRDVAAENADREGHVACDAAAMDDQIVDQEAQRHLLQVIGQKLFGEFAGKPHQMVGRN